ncbi:MAG: Gfo/Idh/MocA family oxidoreductase [Nitratireductor sp.]|nr:Gfo/Idh/MocA family oxidoreductase [Nitratireductor sp.]
MTDRTPPLRVVVVGTGFVAPYHVAGWRQAGCEVVAAVTRDPAAPRLAELGIPAGYRTLEEAIGRTRPDAIDIASPPLNHPADCGVAIQAGLPFMCQKPLAANLADARAIVAAAGGLPAMVHENFRFRPWNRALKAELDAGAIGTPFFARSSERKAGTVTIAEHPGMPWSLARQPRHAALNPFLILESVIHQIDVARYLFGEPRRLFARARRVSPLVAAEDTALLTLAFDDMDVSIERSYASKGHPSPQSGGGERVLVEGAEGSAFLTGDGRLTIIRDGPAGRREWAPEFDRTDAYARSYADCIAHFVQGLGTGAAFETSLEDNLKTLTAVFAAYRSIETGEAVDLQSFGSDECT